MMMTMTMTKKIMMVDELYNPLTEKQWEVKTKTNEDDLEVKNEPYVMYYCCYYYSYECWMIRNEYDDSDYEINSLQNDSEIKGEEEKTRQK
jgi:hypothetical protein